MASSLLLPRATFAATTKHLAVLHPPAAAACRPHPPRLIRCGAAAVPDDELLRSLYLVQADAASPVVSADTGNDGWAALLDEIRGSLQAEDSSSSIPAATSGGVVVPDELLTAPPSVVIPDEILGADPSSTLQAPGPGGGAIPEDLLAALHLDASNPVVRAAWGALSRLDELTSGLSGPQRWAAAAFAAATWAYLTARPGVLSGAVDAYVLAPLQLAVDSAVGRRSLRMSDFVVGERIGEGSFGVVYSGAVVPRGGAAPAARKGKAKTRLELDERYKEKVILKKIKVGTAGAKECGDYEEWFNYRVARAAPESCAEFLGSFVADKTKSEFVKGGKWLVWKFEVNSTSTHQLMLDASMNCCNHMQHRKLVVVTTILGITKLFFFLRKKVESLYLIFHYRNGGQSTWPNGQRKVKGIQKKGYTGNGRRRRKESLS